MIEAMVQLSYLIYTSVYSKLVHSFQFHVVIDVKLGVSYDLNKHSCKFFHFCLLI